MFGLCQANVCPGIPTASGTSVHARLGVATQEGAATTLLRTFFLRWNVAVFLVTAQDGLDERHSHMPNT